MPDDDDTKTKIETDGEDMSFVGKAITSDNAEEMTRQVTAFMAAQRRDLEPLRQWTDQELANQAALANRIPPEVKKAIEVALRVGSIAVSFPLGAAEDAVHLMYDAIRMLGRALDVPDPNDPRKTVP